MQVMQESGDKTGCNTPCCGHTGIGLYTAQRRLLYIYTLQIPRTFAFVPNGRQAQQRTTPSPQAESWENISRKRLYTRKGQTHCHEQQRSSDILSVLNRYPCRWDLKRLNIPPEILTQGCPGVITGQGFPAVVTLTWASCSISPGAAVTESAGKCGGKAARAVQSSFSIIKYFDSSTKKERTKQHQTLNSTQCSY